MKYQDSTLFTFDTLAELNDAEAAINLPEGASYVKDTENLQITVTYKEFTKDV